ncbi:MAG TPA: CRISPR-associated endonuclease Cas2 [Bacteroidetes bacterium]|nr:CRISPR-associated endonuclease Cas2 [Bacteroidota bacterium]
MSLKRISAYRIMWLFVFFDLPTNTKKERKIAAGFRKKLLKDGFSMMQYSVYVRHCASKESAEVHQKRTVAIIPSRGQVSILQIGSVPLSVSGLNLLLVALHCKFMFFFNFRI